MSATAAEAAKKALNWAETAEAALAQVDEYRMQANRYEGARAMPDALHHRALADDFEAYRDRAVDMSTMWAHVSIALHATETGGRP
jgi:hypothetical protein